MTLIDMVFNKSLKIIQDEKLNVILFVGETCIVWELRSIAVKT